jgi:hypothetical protein
MPVPSRRREEAVLPSLADSRKKPRPSLASDMRKKKLHPSMANDVRKKSCPSMDSVRKKKSRPPWSAL